MRNRGVLAALVLMGVSFQSHAQFSLTSSNYTQNFNLLGTGNSTVTGGDLGLINAGLSGWYFLETGTGANTTITAGTGTGTGGDTYNVGVSGGSDRALGGLQSGSVVPSFGFWFQNNTGGTISSLTIGYRGETWRIGATGRSDSLTFSSSANATNLSAGTWTTNSPLSYNNTAAVATASGSLLQSTNISGSISSLSIAPGSSYFIRWSSIDVTGADDLLAINDFSLTALYQTITELFWNGGTWASSGPGTGGAGTWENGQGSWNSANLAKFQGTGGTVTVGATGATANKGISFEVTGYTVSGGTLTLGGATTSDNAVTVASGATANIDSVVAGTTGLSKQGAGTLALNGANTFSGAVEIAGGTLHIGSDGALGDTANDLANNGTLKTTSSISLDAGRDVSGSGTFDIANATTLTVNGAFSNSATTLANRGTLDLRGATRNVGNLTINAAATVNAAGAINASGLTTVGLTSGTATINPDIIFTVNDKTLDIAAGGTLDLNGTLSNGGTSGRIVKTGAGTLILSGSNNMGGLRIGASSATPTDGGKVILDGNAVNAIGSQAQAIQLNFGTLEASSAMVVTNGVSLGGRTGAVATLTGSDIEFQGQSAFFRGTGTSGEMALNVNNKTTLSGGLAVSSGSGTATGVTVGGTGTLIISGTSSGFVDKITTANSVKLVINSSDFGADVSVSANTVLGGTGTLKAVTLNGGTIAPGNSPGVLSMASLDGSNGTFAFEIGAPTTRGTTYDGINVTGALTLGSGTLFNFTQWNAHAFQDGDTYDLFNWSTLVATSFDEGAFKNALGNQLALGGDLKWDTSNFLSNGTISVIPEPSSQLLLALGLAGLAGMRAIRRRQRP